MATKLLLTTYRCPTCNYSQNFNPSDLQQVNRNFPEYPDLPMGKCPSCWGRHITSEMGLGLSEHTATAISTDPELEAIEELDVQADGSVPMVESGEYKDKLINDNGTPRFIQEPVMVPKKRPIAASKVPALKEKRDRNFDELGPITVKELPDERTS